MAEFAGNGDEFLFATAFESARVLSRLDGCCWAACANVLVHDTVDVVARLDADGLHAERTHGDILVVARLDGTAVVFVPVVIQTELFAAAIAPARQLSSQQDRHRRQRGKRTSTIASKAQKRPYVKGRKSFFSLHPRCEHACTSSGNSMLARQPANVLGQASHLKLTYS